MTDMSEETYGLLKRRDAELKALREYVKALEQVLVERRGSEAEDEARAQAWDSEIALLRYWHGFKSDGSWRGDE